MGSRVDKYWTLAGEPTGGADIEKAFWEVPGLNGFNIGGIQTMGVGGRKAREEQHTSSINAELVGFV